MYNVIDILKNYSLKDISIATLSSHSALQILKGFLDKIIHSILILFLKISSNDCL